MFVGRFSCILTINQRTGKLPNCGQAYYLVILPVGVTLPVAFAPGQSAITRLIADGTSRSQYTGCKHCYKGQRIGRHAWSCPFRCFGGMADKIQTTAQTTILATTETNSGCQHRCVQLQSAHAASASVGVTLYRACVIDYLSPESMTMTHYIVHVSITSHLRRRGEGSRAFS